MPTEVNLKGTQDRLDYTKEKLKMAEEKNEKLEKENKELHSKLEEKTLKLKVTEKNLRKVIPLAFPEATEHFIKMVENITKTIKESGLDE